MRKYARKTATRKTVLGLPVFLPVLLLGLQSPLLEAAENEPIQPRHTPMQAVY